MATGTLNMLTPHHLGIVVADLDTAVYADIESFGYSFFQFTVNEGNSGVQLLPRRGTRMDRGTAALCL